MKFKDFLQYKIWGDYKCGGVRGFYHWIRCHFWNRYHIINISGVDEYDWGWIDRDRVLLYSSFKILCDFVDQEDPNIGLRTLKDFGASDDEWHIKVITAQLEKEKEIRALYTWWTKERPENWKEYPSFSEEEKLNQQDEDMLIRLAKIRLCLWT